MKYLLLFENRTGSDQPGLPAEHATGALKLRKESRNIVRNSPEFTSAQCTH